MSEKDILSGHQSLCDKRQKRIVSKEKRSSHTAVNEKHQLVRQCRNYGNLSLYETCKATLAS